MSERSEVPLHVNRDAFVEPSLLGCRNTEGGKLRSTIRALCKAETLGACKTDNAFDLVASGIAVYNPQPFCAGIAQLVERVIRNDEVVGSIPISGTIFRNIGRLAQR